MSSSADLQFDKMVVDTKLAEEYMKKNNFEFRCIGMTNKDEAVLDAASNKIYCWDCSVTPPDEIKSLHTIQYLVPLATAINKNMNLFCQLEYLIRQKPIETTRLELKMIIKHLCYQANLNMSKMQVRKRIVMKDDSALIDLGCFAFAPGAVDILASENMAVVCYLFTTICQSAGYDSMKLGFISSINITFDKYSSIIKNKVLNGGSIGVVTAKSDLDSAVEMFLSAPSGDLWGIRRILVQESVSERLKKEFAWKTRSGSQDLVHPQLKSQCADAYVYEHKIFLREYVGSTTSLRDVTLIESFRTVKELLTLIESYSPFCVTLWSDGVAESNEIAFGITTPMVWVNRSVNLDFMESPRELFKVSLAYYTQIRLNKFVNSLEMDEVRKLQKVWAKLTLLQRRVILGNKVKSVTDKNPSMITLAEHCLHTYDTSSKNFVSVNKCDLVIGISKPLDVYAVHSVNNLVTIPDFLKCLLDGSGFLISNKTKGSNLEGFLKCCVESEVPVRFAKSEFVSDTSPLPHTTRIVVSRFGTIFAN